MVVNLCGAGVAYGLRQTDGGKPLKVVKHIEMPKAGPKKSICHFQKLEMILKCMEFNRAKCEGYAPIRF